MLWIGDDSLDFVSDFISNFSSSYLEYCKGVSTDTSEALLMALLVLIILLWKLLNCLTLINELLFFVGTMFATTYDAAFDTLNSLGIAN